MIRAAIFLALGFGVVYAVNKYVWDIPSFTKSQ